MRIKMTEQEAKEIIQSRITLIDKHYPEVTDYREALVIALRKMDEQKIWLKSFDTSSATECYKAVNKLKKEIEESESK